MPLYFPGFRPYASMFSGTMSQRLPRFPITAPDLRFPDTILAQLCAHVARIPHLRIGPVVKLISMLPGGVTVACDDSGSNGSMDTTQVLSDPRVAAGQSLWVQGWLYRDPAGAAKHKECIKEFFSPAAEVKKRVEACIQENRVTDNVLVGVHLRRGDYRKWSGGKYYYDDKTLGRLMQQILEILPNRKVCFLMVSNQPVERHNYNGFDIALGPGDPAGDLFCMAACDYIIGPPSTFTMWASFYGDVPLYMIKDTLAPIRLDNFTVCK